jgi:cytochrome bd-type quinol oxidase subunit 2
MKKTLFAISSLLIPFAAKAQDLGGGLLNSAGTTAQYNTTAMPETIVGTVINIFLGILGVIFLVLIVYGGYVWMIARGNEAEVEKAKDTMTRSVIGLAIVLAAYGITYFVLSKLLPAATR